LAMPVWIAVATSRLPLRVSEIMHDGETTIIWSYWDGHAERVTRPTSTADVTVYGVAAAGIAMVCCVAAYVVIRSMKSRAGTRSRS
jgi:hypothetical protein